ncbi:DUF6232 family protein [Actinomycetes bacterium KLBMP 9797]
MTETPTTSTPSTDEVLFASHGVTVSRHWLSVGRYRYPLRATTRWWVVSGPRPRSVRVLLAAAPVLLAAVGAVTVVSESTPLRLGVLATVTAYMCGTLIKVRRTPRPLQLVAIVDGRHQPVLEINDIDLLDTILRALNRALDGGGRRDTFYTRLRMPGRFGADLWLATLILLATLALTTWSLLPT